MLPPTVMPSFLFLYLPSLSAEFLSTSSVPGVDPNVRLPPQGLSASAFLPCNISIPGSLFPLNYFAYGVDPSVRLPPLSLPLQEFLFLLILSHQYVHLPIPSHLLPFSQTPHTPQPWNIRAQILVGADILQVWLLSSLLSPHTKRFTLWTVVLFQWF